jgi:predicted DNA-binding protein with PD1-like motif
MIRYWVASAALSFSFALPAALPAQTVTEATPLYLAPAQLKPSGQAPAMKVQLLSDQGGQKEYAVIFYKGDEALSGLTAFAQKYDIKSAHFTAIGAVSAASVGWFDPARKQYKVMPLTGQMEVVSMIGDIALYNGKPVVHTHVVLALPDGTTRGGHVVELQVKPTLEVMVTADPKDLHKRLDPETDFALIDPAANQ